MRRSHGFTITEILIAASITMVLFAGAFSIYRSGSESFLLGDWKIHAQKDAQRFLAILSSDLRQANNALTIASASTSVAATTPVYVKSTAFYRDDDPVKSEPVNVDDWIPLVFFSISRPNIRASEFSPARPGLWKGMSLWAKDGSLTYTKTGNANKFSTMPDNIPGGVTNYMPPGVSPGGDFRPSTEDYSAVVLEDVESMSFCEKSRSQTDAGTERVLQITINMRRMRLNNATTVIQSIDVPILNDVTIETF